MVKAIAVGFALTLIGGFVSAPRALAADWCEANCKSLCTKIYGSAGAANCFAQIPCANYAGRACAPQAVVNARYVIYCHSHKGTGTCR